MLKVFRFRNGLSAMIKPIKGTKAVSVFVMVPVGSRYEDKKLGGASHFVEHLMFKGTKKRPTTLDISRELDAVGAHFNAFTGKDYTCYYVKINASKQGLAMDILSDMLFNSKFDAEEIKKEKGVIMEEIKMYKDDPMSAVEELADNLSFGDHPLGRNIAGTISGIKKMSRSDLFNYYRSVYAPGNMVVVAAGAIDKNTQKLVEKYFGGYRATTKLSKNNFQPFKKFAAASANKRLGAEKRKIDQAHVVISYPGLRKDDARKYAMALLMNILGGGMSSRLFVEVRERRGLAYRVRAESIGFRDTGAVVISTGLDQSRLREAFAVIDKETSRIAAEPVSQKELTDAKNCLIGHLTLAMEDSQNQAQWFADNFWFSKKIETLEEAIAKLKKVKASDVLKLAEHIFKPENKRVAVISGKSKSQIFKVL